MNPLAPVIAIALPTVLCVAEHYAPWQRMIGQPLPQFAAYVLGSLSVFIPATIASLFANSIYEVLALFWLALFCAGVSVGAMRGIEHQQEKENRLRDQLDRQYYGTRD
jgi:hypothetical protein